MANDIPSTIMNDTDLKAMMVNLPEKQQEALAYITLVGLKKKSQLEKIAKGSVWAKLGWLVPVFVSMFFISGSILKIFDVLPMVIVFLLFMIHLESSMAHRRMDAIYELLRAQGLPSETKDVQAGQGVGDSAVLRTSP